jgi:hypothetical protein
MAYEAMFATISPLEGEESAPAWISPLKGEETALVVDLNLGGRGSRRVPTTAAASTPLPTAASLCQAKRQRAEGERRGSEWRAARQG